MDHVFQGPAKISSPSVPPRFALGRVAAGGGLAACLWLWTSTGALAAGADPTAYRNALASFNRGDDSRALSLLEHAPANGTSASEQADVFNLRGAIYLRQGRYDQAQAEFARASKTDRSLWAARFNEAEVSFRQKHYAESRRQFAALLYGTSRLFHAEEHKFVQYKLLLAGICAGDEKPALDFIADYRDSDRPPLGWYYLQAALARRQGAPQKADQWLAQADSRNAGGAGQTYAESFDRLGWGNDMSRHGVADSDRFASKAAASRPRPSAAPALANTLSAPRTLAVVEVLPEAAPVSFRDTSANPAARSNGHSGPVTPSEIADAISSLNAPPSPDEALAALEANIRAVRDAEPALPSTFARPRKGRGTPSPSPTPAGTPDTSAGVTANQGGPTPAPSAAPSGTPSDEFTGKYEEAYAKFLEKNYPDSLLVLDEADKIQPGQPQSISLRFKCHYALAYLEYRKQNYPGALAELDLADQTQKNADSFNLRGLIFSKQHNYDQAEGMFHKAIVTDTALWAAKFNYAELPFNRGNYTDARTRFEELFSQTDGKKQPREAELTQYKVFLTLLLEGKVEAASTFMDHLNFSGATPARYFCNAALNFRAGSVDKAKNWIDDAKKEYPPQLVAIFIESFYRLGWMADPNAPPGTLVAQTTPAPTPAVTTSGTLPTTVTTATASPTATPMIFAAASPTPTPLAVAPTPTATPSATARPAASPSPAAVVVATPTATPARTAAALASASPSPTATATPVIAAFTPVPAPTRPAVALASATPAPTASVPAVALATPSVGPVRPPIFATASPAPAATAPAVIAAASASPSPTASPRPTATAPAVVLVPTPTATPARSVAPATVAPTPAGTPAVARATPTPTVAPATETASASADRIQKRKKRVRLVLGVGLLLEFLYFVTKMRSVLSRREQNRRRAAARRRGLTESSK